MAKHVGWSVRAVDVITVSESALERYGTPEHNRSDNGPEFIAYAIQHGLQQNLNQRPEGRLGYLGQARRNRPFKPSHRESKLAGRPARAARCFSPDSIVTP